MCIRSYRRSLREIGGIFDYFRDLLPPVFLYVLSCDFLLHAWFNCKLSTLFTMTLCKIASRTRNSFQRMCRVWVYKEIFYSASATYCHTCLFLHLISNSAMSYYETLGRQNWKEKFQHRRPNFKMAVSMSWNVRMTKLFSLSIKPNHEQLLKFLNVIQDGVFRAVAANLELVRQIRSRPKAKNFWRGRGYAPPTKFWKSEGSETVFPAFWDYFDLQIYIANHVS